MKRNVIATLIFCCIQIFTYAQITHTEAYTKIEDYMRENKISDSIVLYHSPIIANQDAIILANQDTLQSPSYDSYVFFIDEYPYKNWGHPCRFLFVDCSSGIVSTMTASFPPNDIFEWEVIKNEIVQVQNLSPHLQVALRRSSPVLNNNASHCYAIIISGGFNCYNNHIRYWNDCSAMYTILKNEYGYWDDNIYVMIADGTDPYADRNCVSYADSSPLDLDNDGIADIEYPATKESITSVCDELSSKLTENDCLFIFTTDHGGTTEDGEAVMYLWGENITATEFANEIDKIKAGSINVVMEQCFSGGFIPKLSQKNRTIATACAADESSEAMPELFLYNEFVYHWMSAVYGKTIDSLISINGVDTNNDSIISMKEAYDYAERADTRDETPQYASIKSHYGEYVSLLGVNKEQNTTVNYQGLIGVVEINGYNVNIINVYIHESANVQVEAIKHLLVGPNTIINKGATFRVL